MKTIQEITLPRDIREHSKTKLVVKVNYLYNFLYNEVNENKEILNIG